MKVYVLKLYFLIFPFWDSYPLLLGVCVGILKKIPFCYGVLLLKKEKENTAF